MARKKLTPEQMLTEILQGVDIVGTMLDRDLPLLRAEVAELKAGLPGTPDAAGTEPGRAQELAAALQEVRELLEQQDRRLDALDRRLTRLTEALNQKRSSN